MWKILWKREKIAPEEQFLPLSKIFYYMMLDFYVKTGVRFSLRDKQLFEITEVEITRVDCTNQTILYAFGIYQQIFLIEWGINIFIFLPHIFYTDIALTVSWLWKTHLNWFAKTALYIRFKLSFQYPSYWNEHITTLMCLSIGTPKNNKFSICFKWKIHYFQVSQNLGRVQPHYNALEYRDN